MVFLVTIAFPVFHCVTLHTCSIVNFASSLFGGFDRDYEALRVYIKVNLGGEGGESAFVFVCIVEIQLVGSHCLSLAFPFLLVYAILLCLNINEERCLFFLRLELEKSKQRCSDH